MSSVQALPSEAHDVPLGSLLGWQEPLPLHESGLSQSVLVALPQAVPEGAFGWVQAPALQTSLVQALPSEVQAVPLGSLLFRHAPFPSHVSGLSQSELAELPQAVPAGALGLEQVPEEQISLVQGSPSLQSALVTQPGGKQSNETSAFAATPPLIAKALKVPETLKPSSIVNCATSTC